MLTQERLKELLNYDPESGFFTRVVGRPGPNARKGDVAGCDNGQGYIRIYVDGRPYKGHRLAFLYMVGSIPKEIDHKNLNRSDNRWANLRAATRSQNISNVAIRPDNTSGFKGVSLHKPNGKWRAQASVSGKKKTIGYYFSPEEASQAYRLYTETHFGEFARAS